MQKRPLLPAHRLGSGTSMTVRDDDPVWHATRELTDVVNRYSTGVAGQALQGVLIAVAMAHHNCDGATAAKMLVRIFESYDPARYMPEEKT
jgi:hypothetical protein